MNGGFRGVMSRQLVALVIATVVLSAGGIVVGAGPASNGEVFGYTRIALGLLGIAGAALLAIGRDRGTTGLIVILVWAAIQSIYYADAPDGNYTRQLIDSLVGMSNSTTVNGTVIGYNAAGFNLAGVVMLLFAWTSRSHVGLGYRGSANTPAA